jgi:rhodanese-related sulfurtransferase
MLYHLSYVGVGGLKVYLLPLALPDNGSEAIHTRRQDMPSTIDEILEGARGRLHRVQPRQAAEEQARGALLVDTRTAPQRANQGGIPGAIVIDRTVLEWRLDPVSPDRIPQATDHNVRIILVCAEGYSSSLAAASLQDIGLVNATDVIGGFEAWKAAGLPVAR